MVPQLLLPVAAATIGLPAQKALWWDRSSAAEARRPAAVLTFYFCAVSFVCPPAGTWNTHHTCFVSGTRATCRMHTDGRCIRACGSGQIRWTRKADVNFRMRTWLVGGGWAGRLLASAGAETMLFSQKTLWPGGPRSGSGYLKHLASFIPPPWKWIQFFGARANEVI